MIDEYELMENYLSYLTNVSYLCLVVVRYGCCADNLTESEGNEELGCCKVSEHGCCKDNRTPATGPSMAGCPVEPEPEPEPEEDKDDKDTDDTGKEGGTGTCSLKYPT